MVRAPKEAATDQLFWLGVEEPFTDTPGRTLGEVCETVGRLHDSLRERPLEPEDFGRLSALYWVLGLDTAGVEPEIQFLQAEVSSG